MSLPDCPKCGGQPVLLAGNDKCWYACEHMNCDMQGRMTDTWDKARDAWRAAVIAAKRTT